MHYQKDELIFEEGEVGARQYSAQFYGARAGRLTVEAIDQESSLDAMHRDPEFALEVMGGLADGMRTLHDMLVENLQVTTFALEVEETGSESQDLVRTILVLTTPPARDANG